MRFASTTGVAKLRRLVPLSPRSYPQGDTHPLGSCGYAELWPVHSVLTDKPRKPFTFTTAVVLAGSSWKMLPTMNGKVFPEWLQSSSSRRTAMAGRDGAFLLPPLLSHFGCRHRCCDSDRFAWKKPFRFPGGGWGGGEAESGEQGCGEAAHRSCSSSESAGSPSAIPA